MGGWVYIMVTSRNFPALRPRPGWVYDMDKTLLKPLDALKSQHKNINI